MPRYRLHVVNSPALRYESTVAFLVPVGSRCEARKATHGLSHVLEHLLFKGGETFPTAQAVSERFATLGGSFNAFTSHEVTVFYGTVPADFRACADLAVGTTVTDAKVADAADADLPTAASQAAASAVFRDLSGGAAPLRPYGNLMGALEVLGDIVARPSVWGRPDEMDREKKVVVQEIEKYEDQPARRLHTLVMEHVYGGDGCDARLSHDIAGTVEDVLGMSNADIKAWWREHYDEPVLLVAGSFADSGALKADIERTLERVGFINGSIEGGGPFVPIYGGAGSRYVGPEYRRPWQWEQLERGRPPARLVVRKVGVAQAHVAVSYPVDMYPSGRQVPILPRLEYARYLRVLCHVLAGSMSSRLWRIVREQAGLAYSVDASLQQLAEGALVCISTGVKGCDLDAAVDLIHAELGRIYDGSGPLTEDEVVRSLTAMVGGSTMSMPASRAHALHAIDHFVHADVPVESVEQDLCALQQMREGASDTARRLNAVARFVLSPVCSFVTAITGPSP
jgi:predicted Zn-dependent peptidase